LQPVVTSWFHTIAGVPFDFYYFKATGAAANNVLLAEVSGVTAAVPEPATWAMMLLGFAGLGFAFRSLRSAPTATRSRG
jgi:hypothetical protein